MTQFGVNRAVLPPRSRTALRHWHENEDEFVIVVSGEVVLREEYGETVLRAGACASFKAGVANGHAFENRSDAEVVLFEIGTRTQNETVHYPDVDLRFERRDGVRQFVAGLHFQSTVLLIARTRVCGQVGSGNHSGRTRAQGQMMSRL